MTHTPNEPPHPLELAAALLLLALEALRPVLVQGAALVLALARWRPAAAVTGATAQLDELAPDCTPAPRPVAKAQPRRRTRRSCTAEEAPCSI